MRYLAQRIGSWAWLNVDVKIETDGPDFTDTSYGVMSGTITPDLGATKAADGRPVFEEGGTLIHVESTYARRWTGIVWSVVPEGGRLRVTVREWLGYLDGLPFQGKIWGVKADPADLARTLLAHVQSFPNGKLGMSVTGSTPVRLGTDSSDKAIAARAKMKAAKATLDARTKTRQKKDAEIQAASKPFATALKTLEAARKAQADVVASLSKTQAGKSAAPLYWPFSTSTVTQWPSASHNGTDFAVAQGTPVPATVDGVVVLTGDDGRGAWCVHIKRSDGLIVQHGHLSRIDARSGQIVNSATRIGLSGGQPGTPGAGTSTGPHLHWELRWDAVWTGPVVDPRNLGPASSGGGSAPGGAALDAAKKLLAQKQAAVDAKKAQRDSAIAPLRAQLDALKLAEDQARAPYEAAQAASQKADEKEREDGGAYRVLASDHPDCWRVLKDLCEAAGMGFTTHTERTKGAPKVELRIAYPARNVYRDDLRFVEGINVISELQPAARSGYATEVLVLGAGEGEASIKASAAAADPRLRKLAVIDDKRVTTAAKAGQVARAELATRRSDVQVDEITVTDHPFARMWSWQVGDVILLQGAGSGPEAYAQKHRITSWQMRGSTKAVLRLERST